MDVAFQVGGQQEFRIYVCTVCSQLSVNIMNSQGEFATLWMAFGVGQCKVQYNGGEGLIGFCVLCDFQLHVFSVRFHPHKALA